MELFVVKDRNGKQVGQGFGNKSLAKTERDRLQQLDGGKLPPPDKRSDANLWDYRVGYGKDHRQHGQA